MTRNRFETSLSMLVLATISACKDNTDPNIIREVREVTADDDKGLLSSEASDWPNWLGPNRDGINSERINTNWSGKEPPILWKKDLGTGYSSFAVVGNRCVTLGRKGNKDAVYCLETESGDELWVHQYECALVGSLHKGGPGATAAIHEGRVYTVGREGQVYCLNLADGSVLWSENPSKDLGVARPQWGFTSSPLMSGDQVVFDFGYVVALDRETGRLVWKSEKRYRPGYGTVAPFEQDGKKRLAVLNNDCLLVVSANDGSTVASYKWTTDNATSSTTPIVKGPFIFVSTGYKQGCTLLKLDGNQLKPVYDHRRMSNHIANSVLWEGHLYGFDGDSHNSRTVKFSSMDFASGDVNWFQRGYGCGTVTIAGGHLILLSDQGELVLAKPDPNQCNEIAKRKVLPPTCYTVPIVSHGLLFCRNDNGQAACVDLRVEGRFSTKRLH